MISRDRRVAGSVVVSMVIGVFLSLSPVDAATVKTTKVTTTKRKAPVATKAKTKVVSVPSTSPVAALPVTVPAPPTTIAATVPATIPAPTTTLPANPFTLTRTIITRNVARGSSAKTALEVIYNPGFAGDLTWTASPERDGISVSFTANPTRNVVEMVVTAAASAPLGVTIFPMTVTGGGVERQFSFVAVVEDGTITPLGSSTLLPGQSWSASIDAIGQVPPGTSGTVTLRIVRSIGFTGALSVTYVAPAGITVGISQNPVLDQATVTVSVATGTPTGNYQVTLLLTAGGVTSTVLFGVQVP
jgi:hypothetical protein